MWLDRYEAILCDLDGCLISGSIVLPGAREVIYYAGQRLWIISNNSTDTPVGLAAKLARLGLDVPTERIVLAGTAAIDYIAKRHPSGRVRIFGTEAIGEYGASRGLVVTSDEPQLVLLTRDVHFDYRSLQSLIRHVLAGAELIVTNEDATHPGEDGFPVPETGALLSMVLNCLPDLDYTVIGKPSPNLYRSIFDRVSTASKSTIAIGDNPRTDGAGAKQAGIDAAIIGTTPGAVGKDLLELLTFEEQPEPDMNGT